MIALLTLTNTRGLEYGKIVQNVFTTAKVGALAGADRARIVGRLERDRGSRQFRRGFLDAARCRSGFRRHHGRDGVRPVRGHLRFADRIAVRRRCLE